MYPYVQVHNGEHSRTVVHRVGLFNKTGHITNIISQSDVVRWLQQHQASLGALKGMTAQQLGWADKQIKSMPAKTPAIEVTPQASLHQTAQFPFFLSFPPFISCMHLYESCVLPGDCVSSWDGLISRSSLCLPELLQ